MNNSKTLIKLSAFALAIAGAIATKASNKSPLIAGWTRNQSTHKCGTHLFGRFCSTASESPTLCKGLVGSSNRTLYTKITGPLFSLCVSTLRTVASN
jgi:hypothetical protein